METQTKKLSKKAELIICLVLGIMAFIFAFFTTYKLYENTYGKEQIYKEINLPLFI